MDFIEKLLIYIQTATVTDVIDILIVAFLIYKVMALLRDTSAERLIKGVVILLVVMQVAHLVHFNTISFVLDKTYTIGLYALIVIFQPELRRILEQVGKGKVVRELLNNRGDAPAVETAILQTVEACEEMSWTRTGVLIVFERTEKLGDIIKTGTLIDADPSKELIKNIFYPKSPLHDGAMIVRDGRILAAGCVLPLSANQSLSKDLGTRHRAAVGMSEVSDAVLVIVSEETGSISVAIGGMLKRHLPPETLEKVLRAELMTEEETSAHPLPSLALLYQWKRKGKP